MKDVLIHVLMYAVSFKNVEIISFLCIHVLRYALFSHIIAYCMLWHSSLKVISAKDPDLLIVVYSTDI